MMGMSSVEWSRYMHDVIGLAESPEEINREVVARMLARYHEELPADRRRRRGGRASGAGVPARGGVVVNRPLIEAVLEAAGIAPLLRVDRVLGGGRSWQARAGRLPRGGPPARARARELRRGRGLLERSAPAHAAGMRVIAMPNRRYPPAEDALALADVTLVSLSELTVSAVLGLSRRLSGNGARAALRARVPVQSDSDSPVRSGRTRSAGSGRGSTRTARRRDPRGAHPGRQR